MIRPSQPPTWESCKSIANGLARAYELALDGARMTILNHNESHSYFRIFQTAHEIRKQGPDYLVFSDYQPAPFRLLRQLKSVYEDGSLPELVIHLYGDFFPQLGKWVECEKDLVGFGIRFICASTAQLNLYSSAFCQVDQLCLVPFPVDTDLISFSAKAREEARSQLRLSAKDFVLIYAGRLSPDKNVVPLVQTLLHTLQAYRIPQKILLVGNLNDFASLVPLRLPINGYYAWLKQVCDNRVTLIPHQNAAELRSLYCAADLFVSLSTASSEIFGLAPAEALCCGLPLALTDWGGYKDFATDDGTIWKFPVNLSAAGPVPTAMIRKDFLDKIYLSRNNVKMRQKRAHAFVQKYGIKAIAEKLQLMIGARPPPTFTSFSEKAHKVYRSSRPQTLLQDINRKYGQNVQNTKHKNGSLLS